jgi:inorganic pyrophosphatase
MTILHKMMVKIETPKWSFIKYRCSGGAFKRDLISPLPTLFNYGYIVGTKALDGMPKDAIVLGRRLEQGSNVDVKHLGTVHFIDDGIEDDKEITSFGDSLSALDRGGIHLFFVAYMTFKIAHYLLARGRLTWCRYGGFSLLSSGS